MRPPGVADPSLGRDGHTEATAVIHAPVRRIADGVRAVLVRELAQRRRRGRHLPDGAGGVAGRAAAGHRRIAARVALRNLRGGGRRAQSAQIVPDRVQLRDVLRRRGRLLQQLPLLLDAGDAIGRGGVIGKPGGLLGSVRLGQGIEKSDHVRRRVAAGGEDLRPAHVGLRLQLAAELQKERVQSDAADRVQDLRGVVTHFPAEQSAQNLQSGLRSVSLGSLMRAVTQRAVRDLVREHAGHFPLIARIFENAAIEIDESARQREGIDVRGVHHAEAILKLRSAGVAANF